MSKRGRFCGSAVALLGEVRHKARETVPRADLPLPNFSTSSNRSQRASPSQNFLNVDSRERDRMRIPKVKKKPRKESIMSSVRCFRNLIGCLIRRPRTITARYKRGVSETDAIIECDFSKRGRLRIASPDWLVALPEPDPLLTRNGHQSNALARVIRTPRERDCPCRKSSCMPRIAAPQNHHPSPNSPPLTHISWAFLNRPYCRESPRLIRIATTQATRRCSLKSLGHLQITPIAASRCPSSESAIIDSSHKKLDVLARSALLDAAFNC
jgi:hypothetical protein